MMISDRSEKLELPDSLINDYKIHDVYYDSQRIEINFNNSKGEDDTIHIPVLEYAHDTLQQLDSLVNGSMSVDQFTQLKHYLTRKFTPVWFQIYGKPSSEKNEPGAEYGNLTRDQFEKELIKKYHFKSLKDTEEIYYYDSNKGIYIKNAEWLIKQECIKFNPQTKTNDVNDTKNRIIWSNYVDRSEFDPDVSWICCKNVMVNLLTGEVKEHSPDFMATVQIPHKYNLVYETPHVPGPQKILAFLHQVMASYEDVETFLDFLAYCLWRDLQYHRFLLFNGSGRNGKGVTTELVTKFLGRENISNETLERLLTNNFASARLFGKLANIDADLSSEELKKTGMLKKITGNDSIPGEIKFKSAFDFKNFAKLIFSANKIPETPDESDAYFARPLIINFPNQYLGDKADPHLIDKLTTEEEMSALLSLILKRLPFVLKNGISIKTTIEDTYQKYMQSSDPIRLFAETSIKAVDDAWEKKDGVYFAFERFCADKNLPKESSETFSRRLKERGFGYKQKKIDGVKYWVWTNIQLKDYRETDEDQEILS